MNTQKRTPAKQRLFEIAQINKKLIKDGKVTIVPTREVGRITEIARVNGWIKHKKDLYGTDSPMVADVARVRHIAMKWITRDATDSEYQWKLTDADFDHLVRDFIAIAPRLLSNHIKPQSTKVDMKSMDKLIEEHAKKIKPGFNSTQFVRSMRDPLSVSFHPMATKPAKKAKAKKKPTKALKLAKTAKAKKALKAKKK